MRLVSLQLLKLPAVLGFALVATAAHWVVAAEPQVPVSREQVHLSYAPVVKKAAPAVVNIYSRKVVRQREVPSLFNDPFFRRFFGQGFMPGLPRARVENSLGSGVVVDAGGTIVTNHHVVAGADEITVVLADRREFEAKLIGSDERTDLAILKVNTGGEELPFLELRDSDSVQVGDLVLAIGNPFGVGQTVTSGIVSALARTRVGVTDLNFFIQTDAAINPGNSGGALIDIQGGLIGVNTAIYSRTGGSMGIGFAIPSNMVRQVVSGFKVSGKVVRPWLGAYGTNVTSDIAHSLGIERPAGVLIEDVYSGGPADRAGIRVGDVLLSVDAKTVDDADALDYRIATLPVGGKTTLKFWRKGREQSAALDLVAPPERPARETTELSGRHPFAGATVVNMSPALAEELGTGRFRPGVIILQIRGGSTAARLGFQTGDSILEVNGQKVVTVAALKSLIDRPADRWRIGIRRGEKTLKLVIGG
jgi:serine protease Do